MWMHTGQKRPRFALEPAAGQESVWDYPRPPAIVPDARLVEVMAGGQLIASSRQTVRVCETASPPTFYIPPGEVDWSLLMSVSRHSFCEWKGTASYWALADNPGRQAIAWSYKEPLDAFSEFQSFLSCYPGRVACFVDGERVIAQPGGFYGGWITSEIVGPFKGEPGTGDW